MDAAARERVLKAGAAAYVEAFSRVPPKSRHELEAELEDVETGLRNAITAALWAHRYDVFVDAVRRVLVKPV